MSYTPPCKRLHKHPIHLHMSRNPTHTKPKTPNLSDVPHNIDSPQTNTSPTFNSPNQTPATTHAIPKKLIIPYTQYASTIFVLNGTTQTRTPTSTNPPPKTTTQQNNTNTKQPTTKHPQNYPQTKSTEPKTVSYLSSTRKPRFVAYLYEPLPPVPHCGFPTVPRFSHLLRRQHPRPPIFPRSVTPPARNTPAPTSLHASQAHQKQTAPPGFFLRSPPGPSVSHSPRK